MPTFTVPVEISRPYGSEFAPMDAQVNTGSTYSVFPSDILESVGVVADDTRTFDMANNSAIELPIGQATIRFAGKQVIISVVFAPPGYPTLLGATTLDAAGLAPDYQRQTLTPKNALLITGFNINPGKNRPNNTAP